MSKLLCKDSYLPIQKGFIVIPDNTTIEALVATAEFDSGGPFNGWRVTSDHFNVTVRGLRNLLMAHFDKGVSSEHVKEIAQEKGYEVGLIEDLLCFGAHPEYRELQLQFPIVALGSSPVVSDISSGSRFTPSLGKSYDERILCLSPHDHNWGSGCRFLFVKKEDKPSNT